MCFQRKTTANENWQKLTKLLSYRSCSGSCGIETFFIAQWSHWGNKKTCLFLFLHHWHNRVDGWDAGMVAFDISPLHFLHLKSGLGFRGPLMLEQCLCTQKPQKRHLIELYLILLMHTSQRNLFALTDLGALRALTMIFVWPRFTHRPFVSKLVFQTWNFNNMPGTSLMINRSSA